MSIFIIGYLPKYNFHSIREPESRNSVTCLQRLSSHSLQLSLSLIAFDILDTLCIISN